jgi:hypothetical protein
VTAILQPLLLALLMVLLAALDPIRGAAAAIIGARDLSDKALVGQCIVASLLASGLYSVVYLLLGRDYFGEAWWFIREVLMRSALLVGVAMLLRDVRQEARRLRGP